MRGKVDGMSYYKMKGVAEGLVRGINAGMSDRVKTADAYANTRKNAAEFAAAGKYSGAVIRSITKRWRTILDSFSTGNLQKLVISLVRGDSTHVWGQRVLTGSNYQLALRQRIEEFVKFAFRDNVFSGFSCSHTAPTADSSTYTVSLDIAADDCEVLRQRGADGVVVEAWVQKSTYPEFVEGAGDFGPATSTVEFLGSVDHTIGSATQETITAAAAGYENEDAYMTNVLLIALPYKTIGGENNTLQEICSMAIVESYETA